jgi:hypothetical protein
LQCGATFEVALLSSFEARVSFLHRSQRPRDRSSCSGAGAHLRMTLS